MTSLTETCEKATLRVRSHNCGGGVAYLVSARISDCRIANLMSVLALRRRVLGKNT